MKTLLGGKNKNEEEKDTTVVSDNMEHSDVQKLICSLCFNFICKCVTASCSHSFCEKCLDDYLILKKTCFICDQNIRNKPITQCFSIDNVIEQLISKCEDADTLNIWKNQNETYR
jgi:hypothetical protein